MVNAGFTAANGVVSGTGSSSDPYVIDGWSISAASGIGIEIRDTDAYAIVRNVDIVMGWSNYADGVSLYNVKNVRIETLTVDGGHTGMSTDTCASVDVVGSSFSWSWYGAIIRESTFTSFTECVFSYNQYGLGATNDSSHLTISGCQFSYCQYGGIDLRESSYVLIADNTITGSPGNSQVGISLQNCPGTSVLRNVLVRSPLSINGWNLAGLDALVVQDNTLNGKPILYYSGVVGLDVEGVDAGQVFVVNCPSARIANLDIDMGVPQWFGYTSYPSDPAAIKVMFSPGATVEGCSIANCWVGIGALNSDGVVITQNSVHAGNAGISVSECSNAEVLSNDVSAAVNDGIEIFLGSDVWVFGNSVNGVTYYYGIVVVDTPNAVIEHNTIANCPNGLMIYDLTGARIFHNSFLWNWVQALVYWGSNNLWDNGYPSGGNYWTDAINIDNRRGVDQNFPGPDGLSDYRQYTDTYTGTGGWDRYPLMEPFVPRQNWDPIAIFTATPQSAMVGTLFTFDASLSCDVEDATSTLQVRWDWESDGVWDSLWSVDKVATHVYLQPGDHAVTMEVLDAGGLSDSFSSTISLTPFEIQPVSVYKWSKQPSSPVRWNFTVPFDMAWTARIDNHGFKSLVIEVYDETAGLKVFHQNIVFGKLGAYPSGTVVCNPVPMIGGHVYQVIVKDYSGPGGSSATVYSVLS